MERLEVVSMVLRGFTRSGSTVGVTYIKGGTYEHDEVPESVWAGLTEVAGRAAEWKRSGRYEEQKPEEVSVFKFYKKQVLNKFPLWTVDKSGQCKPENALARRWEVQRGPRGKARGSAFLASV